MSTRSMLAALVWLSFFGASRGLHAAVTTTLPGGAYVVVDTGYDLPGPVSDVGSVSLYSSSGTLLGTRRGSTANDQVGSGGITVIGTNAFVICSPLWNNGTVVDAGAVSFGSTSGFATGAVSAANSFVGSSTNDQVGGLGGVDGSSPVTVIGTTAYVVCCPLWDNGAAANAGAVAYGSTSSSNVGEISSAKALVGASAGDYLGSGGITLLGDGAFVCQSPSWANGTADDAGAVTAVFPLFGAVVGVVSATNSYVGSSANDQLGSGGITSLGGGSYLFHSPLWNNGAAVDAGAVTTVFPMFGPIAGVVSATNSYVGSSTNDQVGSGGVTLLSGGAYLFRSPLWNNGAAADAGAVTAVFPSSGATAGVVSAANSYVGSSTNDQVGSGGITLLGGGAYLLRSPLWNNGTVVDAGAVTAVFPSFGPIAGVVSATNSYVGSSTNDQVGSGGITLLGGGAYLFRSPLWNNGAATDAGAVTAVSPSSGAIAGVVSATNSYVGSSNNDQIGSGGITLLGGGSYLFRSPLWDNGSVRDAGAVTAVFPVFEPVAGVVSATNSLVGSSSNDQVGSGGVTVVGTAYVILSPLWDNGTTTNAGAATFAASSLVRRGEVSALNSLVGTSPNDQIGSGGTTAIGTAAWLVRSPLWDHRGVADAGAVSFGGSNFYPVGEVSAVNALVGSHPNDQIGSGGITVQGGNAYTISSPNWCYGAGASTTGGITIWNGGVISSSNSTVGTESAVSEIVLQQPALTEVANNGSRDFGTVLLGSTQGLAFVIRNTGNDDLLLTGSTRVSITGTDAALFSVVAPPPSLIVTGDSASFTVNITPTSEGAKTAMLSIANNDSNENPYRISLTAAALSQVSNWRQTHFGSNANTGTGADDADFDHDGIPNLVEYALGLHPAQSTTSQLPLPTTNGGSFGLSFNQPAGITGIAYGAEWSTSLIGGTWQPVTDTGTPPQHIFSVPINGNTKLFMRLKVTASP